MVIWPWSRFQKYDLALERANARGEQVVQLKESIQRLETLYAGECSSHKIDTLIAAKDAELAAVNLRTAERDLERLANEYDLLKADFKGLVAQTAGRLQPRVAPLDLDRDPFREDPKIPTEWLTDDSESLMTAAEELLDRGQSEDGEQRGPAARQRAEG